MQVSFTSGLDDGRAEDPIGQIRATTRWRAADNPGSEANERPRSPP